MGRKMRTVAGTLALSLCIGALAWPALAQDSETRTERVQFEQGASSATIASRIQGYNSVDYLVGARAGQVMSVKMSTNNASSYFNVLPPGSQDEALFVGSTRGSSFLGNLPESGDYKIRVYLMRNAARRGDAARYQLTISIKN